MYILGDIGNSETKVFLVNSKNRIIKNINFPSKQINNKILNLKFKYLIKDFKESIKNKDIAKYKLTDTKFHKSFFILSSNRYLIKNYENINSIIETIRTHTGSTIVENYKLIDSINGHISIQKHIEEKNLNLALDELDKHINSWHDDRIIKSHLISSNETLTKAKKDKSGPPGAD